MIFLFDKLLNLSLVYDSLDDDDEEEGDNSGDDDDNGNN